MSLGVWSIAWGLTHISKPPMTHSVHPYATSRQLGSIAGGVPLFVMGLMAYRRGRSVQAALGQR